MTSLVYLIRFEIFSNSIGSIRNRFGLERQINLSRERIGREEDGNDRIDNGGARHLINDN
jgi:hypothetical protein